VTTLITGGAGYVGSHALRELLDSGVKCVVLDNLSRGHRELVGDTELVVGNIGDRTLVRRIFSDFDIDSVMHFAAFAYVGESVQAPALYYENNVAATLALLQTMVEARIKHFVFSSTCATYGVPTTVPIPEDHPLNPVNPYGASKLMVERILADFDAAYGLKSVALRYFNAAGADPHGRTGEWHEPETHLIPIALQVARGGRTHVDVYGTDYPTPDGTCVRDYVHVTDLAQAHFLALRHLQSGAASTAINLGNGDGLSVYEVLDTVEKVTGRKVARAFAPRRPGDPPALVGSSTRARQVLGWAPRWSALEAIIETAWKWETRRTQS
jgi:UDP-glucose 4-epimerase